MLKVLREKIDKVLGKLRLKPLSLAEKCRLQFGAAVLLSLIVALYVPYLWMDKLTYKIALDAGRALTDTVFERHFQIESEKGRLPILAERGSIQDPNQTVIVWSRLDNPNAQFPNRLNEFQRKQIESLIKNEENNEYAWVDTETAPVTNNYIRIIHASETCLACHNPDGVASTTFNKNALVGAVIVRVNAREHSKTLLMNKVTAIVAGLLAGTAAMVAFYTIAQRIILRPIRQLRALANNIAEGNLDARSAIKSGDEYERLAESVNHMLDVLQESQDKLSQANKQLDGKIAELSDRNVELFKANRLKSEFLANMSHEVRTPLNAILGFAQLLYEKPLADEEKSKRYAQNIITSGRSLLNMINDLLDLAKAEAGKMKLHVEKTTVSYLCQSLVDFFGPLSFDNNIQMSLDIAQDIPVISTDSGKVRQILFNLLSNAIKFTPEQGKVIVIARMLDAKTVRISVSDTGPGIAEENHEKIFEKFRQVDGSLTRKGDGTGLGLAISRELASLLAGAISVESRPGKGATFHLDIPVTLPGEPRLII